MFNLLENHIKSHNSPQIQVIPYDHNNVSNKIDFPADLKVDLIFSTRSFNYLYTTPEYEHACKTNLKDSGLIMFDFNNSPHHKDAPNCHVFKEPSSNKIEHLKQSSPPNAYRLLMPKSSYNEYKGIHSNTNNGIYITTD